MDLAKRIDEFIEKNKYEIVSRTCDFVKIPSINIEDLSGTPYGKECARALDFCIDVCKEKNLITENYDYKCVEVRCNENQHGKRLVIAAHADVVPTVDDHIYLPFCGKVIGDYIVGRGVVDDKGPLIATLYALTFFKEYGIVLNNDIRLVFGSNEECGMDDLEYYLEKKGQPDWGLAVDDDFPVTNGEKGLIRFSITAEKANNIGFIDSYGSKQRLIHDHCKSIINDEVSVVDKTEGITNPIVYAVLNSKEQLFKDDNTEKVIKALIQDISGEMIGIDVEDRVSGKTQVRVYEIITQEKNITLNFDIRTPVTLNIEDVLEKIDLFALDHNLNIKIVKRSDGYFVPEDNEIVTMLTNLYNTTANANEKPYVMGACTYARLFKNGCGFGGGNPHEVKPFPVGHGAAHGADEAHNIQVLLDAVKMYILGIKAIDDLWSK